MAIKLTSKGVNVNNVVLKSGNSLKQIKVQSTGNIVWATDCPLKLTIGTGISKIYYSVDGGSTYTAVSSSTTVNVKYETEVFVYAVEKTGYGLAYANSTSWAEHDSSASGGYRLYGAIMTESGLTFAPISQVKNFTLTLTDTTSYTLSAKRTSSPNKGATIGSISTGGIIYYGDVIEVTATAKTGYSVSGGNTRTNTYTVTGNVIPTFESARLKYNITYTVETTGVTSVKGDWWSESSAGIDDSSSFTSLTLPVEYGDTLQLKHDSDNLGRLGVTVSRWDNGAVRHKAYFNYNDVEAYAENVQCSSIPATITGNLTITASVNRTANEYPIQLNISEGISAIYYNINGTEKSVSATTTINVPYGSSVQLWAVAATGYTTPNYHSGSKHSFTMGTSRVTFTPTNTTIQYKLYLVKGGSKYGRWSITSDTSVEDSIGWYVPCHYGDTLTKSGDSFTLKCAHSTDVDNSFTFHNDSATGYTYTVSYGTVPTTITGDTTITATTSRSANNYRFAVTMGEGINALYLKVGSATSYTKYTASINRTDISYGTSISWYAEPKTGYNLASGVPTSSAPKTLTLTESGYSFNAYGNLKTFNLEISAYNYGYIRVSGSSEDGSLDKTGEVSSAIIQAKYGDILSVSGKTITLYVGETSTVRNTASYVQPQDTDQWTYSCGAFTGYSTPVTGNQTISISGSRVKKGYTLKLVKNTGIQSISYKIDNGSYTTVTASTNITVSYGSTVTCYATVATGYNDIVNNSSKPYSTVMYENGVEFAPITSLKTYTLTVKSGTNGGTWKETTDASGTIENASAVYSNVRHFDTWKIVGNTLTVYHGSNKVYEATFTPKAYSGYTVGSSFSGTEGTISGATTITGNTTKTVNSYKLTFAFGTGIASYSYSTDGGSTYTTVSSAKSVDISYGTSVRVYATVATGYVDHEYTKSTPYIFQMGTSGETVNWSTITKTYTMTLTTGANGGTWTESIDGSASATSGYVRHFDTWKIANNVLTVTRGSTVVYKATFAAKSYTGYTVGTEFPVTEGTVTGNVSVVGNTTKTLNNYNLTFTLGTGIASYVYTLGSNSAVTVTSNKTVAVPYGTSVSVYATAATGYNTPSYNSGNKYTFTMGAATKTINWSSNLKTFTLTLTTNGEGYWNISGDSSTESKNVTIQYNDTISTSGNTLTVKRGTSTILSATYVAGHKAHRDASASISVTTGSVTGARTATGSTTYSWTAYKLTINTNTGVSSVTVKRTSSPNAGASTGSTALSNGTSIYYGDVLSITASPSTGYQMSSYATSLTVDGNETVSPTATLIPYTLTFANTGGVGWSTNNSIGSATSSKTCTVYYGDTCTKSGNAVTVKRGSTTVGTYYYHISTDTSIYDYSYNISGVPSTITGSTTITGSMTTARQQYKLTITKGTGVASVTVNRTSSPAGGGQGELSSGATIYAGDILSVSASASTGYSLYNYATSYSVDEDVNVSISAYVPSYILTISVPTGVASVTVNRTESPYAKASTGALSNGATIYRGDKLSVSATASAGYTLGSYTTSITVDGNETATATASLTPYTLTFKNTGGSGWTTNTDSSVASTKTMTVYYGYTVSVSGTTVTVKDSAGTTKKYFYYHTISDTSLLNYSYSISNATGTITGSRTITGTTTYTPFSYTLSISKGTGVSTVTVNRTSSPYANAGTGALSHGATIYGGDVLSISATASTGYTLYDYKKSETVDGNISVSVSAYPNNYTLTVKNSSYGGVIEGPSSSTATANGTITASVRTGDVISYSGSTLYVKRNGSTIHTFYFSNPKATSSYSYAFSSWTNGSTTISGNVTVTANVTRTNLYACSFSEGGSYTSYGSWTVQLSNSAYAYISGNTLYVPSGSVMTVGNQSGRTRQITIKKSNGTILGYATYRSDYTYTASSKTWYYTISFSGTGTTTTSSKTVSASLTKGNNYQA